jgi:hypothetical protein
MNFSYTQVSQFLSCPRRYRYQYLDGWKEKDTRAAMLFGRYFAASLFYSRISRVPKRFRFLNVCWSTPSCA